MEFGEIPRCSLSYPIREVKGYFLIVFVPSFPFSFLFFILLSTFSGSVWKAVGKAVVGQKKKSKKS